LVTEHQIRDFADAIVREFKPEKIILFGSYAGGTPDEDSDVDLLVIVDHPGKPHQEATRIRNRLDPSFPIDLLVRTPRQLADRLEMGDPFIREIVRKGAVLYETGLAY
jgi:predicted nucleotidyltransferase